MKTDRLVGMIMLLLDKERISAQELAERFEVSERTVYRDIDAINMAGIPVRSTPGVGGGFEIMKEYKLEKGVFSSSELSAILMGLKGLSGMLNGSELGGAIAKVQRFIPHDSAGEVEFRAGQIYVDLSPWFGNESVQQNLSVIKTALQSGKLLSFDYNDRHGSKTARIVEPYRLVLKSSHWYLQGYCRSRNDFRLFKLSRISALQPLTESFTPRPYEQPQLAFEDNAAVKSTRLKLRVHSSAMDRVLDYCGIEHFTSEDSEHYLVDFPFVENEYYYDILISFGDKCECLEPPQIRAHLKERIAAIAALYAD